MREQPSPDVLMERLDNLGRQLEIFRAETNIKLDRLDSDISENYVSREEFGPVKAIVYGLAGLILAGFVGMLLYIVGWHK